jgi:hypothetical protein
VRADPLAAFLLVVALVVRFAGAFAARRDAVLVLLRADVFVAFRAFFGAARFAAAFRADDFFAVFLAVRFRRGGGAATGGINKGSLTSPSAANGM